MRRGAWILVCLLTACVSSPALPSPSHVVTASRSPSAPPPIRGAASATPGQAVPIGSVLPTHLAGLELHTFAVGGDILTRLADARGVMVEELEAAFASEHGARFIQMYAVRLPGTDAASLASAWAVAAYPPGVDDVEVSDETIAGRRVTVVSSPSLAPRVGRFYLVPGDDILFVVQTFDPVAAEEALAALP